MDLVDRIETTRFLGGEFVLWLWLSRDVTEGMIELPEVGSVEVNLESALTLIDPLAEKERVAIRGVDPCATREADQALRRGKLPRKVGLRFVHADSEWICTIDAATLALSGVRLPALLSEGEEEHFHERMRLFEQLHGLVQRLYRHFLGVRLTPAYDEQLLPAMRRWVGGEIMERASFESLFEAEKPKRVRRKK
jgi:hypothetical protein